MITEDKITEFFCISDDFYKIYDAQLVKMRSNSSNSRYFFVNFLSKSQINRIFSFL